MKISAFMAATFALIMFSTACGQPAAGPEAISSKPRNTSPAVSQSDLQTLVNGNGAFAFDLYQRLKSAEGNIFFSPYSISEAMAMTFAGARGDTEKQMAQALHLDLAQAALHPAVDKLDLELASRGKDASGKDGKGFQLKVVNALWGQKNYAFLPSFLDLLAENYGSGLRLLDFIKAPEDSRITINNWVSDQTNGRIKDLIPPGMIDSLTRLVLTNAIYFNAAWANQFEKNATQNGTFYLPDGKAVSVPFMHQSELFKYYEDSGLQAVELPYDGNQFSMVILLPASGQFNDFEGSLNSQISKDIIDKLENKRVSLALPRFKYDSSFDLKQALMDMGMPLAFSADADFSGMTGARDVYISDVVHKAFVAVDESGTEAAAATAVVMVGTAAPIKTTEMTVNRPFIYLIRDIPTGAILFLGRVLNPS